MTACSEAAADEPLPGTATSGRFLLAVEQSGPYAGRDAVTGSSLSPGLGRALTQAVGSRGGRLLLIRRQGAHPVQTHVTRRVFLSVARFPRTTTWTAELADPLQALQWLDTPAPHGARQLGAPVLLVCTHGRRDVCCARHGRGLLRSEVPFEVWESSHQGGHRLAPVVWELTTGYQHGRVTPTDLRAIGDAAARGRVHLTTARGHFALEAPMQAAELTLRLRNDIDRLDALQVRHGPVEGTYLVEGPDRRWIVRTTRKEATRTQSCGAEPTSAVAYGVQVQPG